MLFNILYPIVLLGIGFVVGVLFGRKNKTKIEAVVAKVEPVVTKVEAEIKSKL